MTTDFTPRLFARDDEIRALGTGLLACVLPREAWTHEAHLGATTWLLIERPDIAAERDLPAIIRAFNESVGGLNDDTQGYHETITQLYIASIRVHLAGRPVSEPLLASVNSLLMSKRGRRDWPLRFYSRDRLFSVEARRGFVSPDICALEMPPPNIG